MYSGERSENCCTTTGPEGEKIDTLQIFVGGR